MHLQNREFYDFQSPPVSGLQIDRWRASFLQCLLPAASTNTPTPIRAAVDPVWETAEAQNMARDMVEANPKVMGD